MRLRNIAKPGRAILCAVGLGLAVVACQEGAPPPQQQQSQGQSGILSMYSEAPKPSPAADQNRQAYAKAHGQARNISQEQYPTFRPNPEIAVIQQPVTTISLDVDTVAYARVRRFLMENRKPPQGVLRIEEMVNYFHYDYPKPATSDAPFHMSAVLAPAPWRDDRLLLRVGIQAEKVATSERPPLNLVYLVDVSGSMSGSDRLGLVKLGLLAMTEKLGPKDRVGIVTYAGGAGSALEPHQGDDKAPIKAAIRALSSGGSTAGAQGLEAAYAMAQANFDKAAVNRVVLLTDGDFNVGRSDPTSLTKLIEDKRKTGVYLSVFTVGSDNLNDVTAQTLAQKGNGNAAYLDGPLEARRAMADDLEAAAIPIADDAKAQLEFNPARVASYRLIGYETRSLANRDFADDKIDAAEVGSGQSVTLIYEIELAGDSTTQPNLRYQDHTLQQGEAAREFGDEWAFLKLRYKAPGASTSQLISMPITDADRTEEWDAVDRETRFAAAVASFGLRLQDPKAMGDFDFAAIGQVAKAASGPDPTAPAPNSSA